MGVWGYGSVGVWELLLTQLRTPFGRRTSASLPWIPGTFDSWIPAAQSCTTTRREASFRSRAVTKASVICSRGNLWVI